MYQIKPTVLEARANMAVHCNEEALRLLEAATNLLDVPLAVSSDAGAEYRLNIRVRNSKAVATRIYRWNTAGGFGRRRWSG